MDKKLRRGNCYCSDEERVSLVTITKRNLAQSIAEVTGTTKLTALPLHMVDSLFEMISNGTPGVRSVA
jgi:hypothetical protein